MAGAEPRDFCSQYPLGSEGFRPNAFACYIYVDNGLVIKIQTLDFKVNLHNHSISNKTVAKTHP